MRFVSAVQHSLLRAFGTTLVVGAALCASLAYSQRRPAKDVEPIEGVQVAALDQPRIYLNLRRTLKGEVLQTKGDAADERGSGIEAFLDTGASGFVLSSDTTEKLGIKPVKSKDGRNVSFEDVGVAGSETFSVAEPLFVSVAPYPRSDPEVQAHYGKPQGAIRAQIRPEGGVLSMLAPGMDIAGMPILQGRVIVIDPSPLVKFDKLQTSLVESGDRSIPKTSRHVPLTMVSFHRFTRTRPPGAAGPDLAPNPMIGPDPLAGFPSTAPTTNRSGVGSEAVVITHGGRRVSGTFLLDTGAATSMISTRLARELGLKLDDDGVPVGIAPDQRLSLTVGGLGGMKQASGLFVDSLELPTREGPPIVFQRAPLLVNDTSVRDEHGNAFTLDGVLGMNYLVASAEVSGGLLPDLGKIIDGPFVRIVVDLHRNELGLEPR